MKPLTTLAQVLAFLKKHPVVLEAANVDGFASKRAKAKGPESPEPVSPEVPA